MKNISSGLILSRLLKILLNLFKRYKIISSILIGAFVLFLFYKIFSSGNPADASSPPHFVNVRVDTLFTDLVLSGDLQSSKAVSLLAPMEWQYNLQIIYLVPEGSHVSKGDTLLKFDASKLQVVLMNDRRELQKKKAGLKELKLQQAFRMTQLKNNLKISRYNLEESGLRVDKSRFESNVKKQQAEISFKQSTIQLKKAEQAIKNQKIIQKSDLTEMNMEVENAQSAIQDILNRMKKFTLISPMSGMVVYGKAWFGSTVRKIRMGDKVRPGQTMIRLPDLKLMESLIFVNEIDIQKIKVGQKAQLWLEAYPDKTYLGMVSEINKISQPQNYAHGKMWNKPSPIHVFLTHVKITDPDSSLKPGMTIKTRVLLDTLPDAVIIPAGAVVEINGKPAVFTRKGRRFIQLGPRNDAFISVLKGLSKNDDVQLPPPLDRSQPLGQLAFYRQNQAKSDSLEHQLDLMKKEGFKFDYNAKRSKIKKKGHK
ncbi:macrolide export protein MacA [bacterium BMS3Abin05]|nr:macrolide export protein MacA [bacterium BMS3Abin05]GBE28085.1 macrolide export protein MacA [bacterium BMS3Bbin03]